VRTLKRNCPPAGRRLNEISRYFGTRWQSIRAAQSPGKKKKKKHSLNRKVEQKGARICLETEMLKRTELRGLSPETRPQRGWRGIRRCPWYGRGRREPNNAAVQQKKRTAKPPASKTGKICLPHDPREEGPAEGSQTGGEKSAGSL